MKKMHFSALLLIMAIFVFSGCKKDDSSGDNNTPAKAGTIKATIDGTSFQSMKLATYAAVENIGSKKDIQIIGSMGTTSLKTITLAVSQSDGVGTYEIKSNSDYEAIAVYTETDLSSNNNVWSTPYDENVDGTITITSLTSTTVEGTFNFKALNPFDNTTKNVTSGSFNVNIQ